jgi:ATP-dependent Clp protease ATP-binding subunit ClpA
LAVKQVRQFAKHGEDPLHLSLQVISGAAACAKALGESEINDRDIIDATARVFKLPSSEQFYRYVNGVKEFKEVARKQAFGQEEAIDALSSAMSSHLLRLKPETKPLVILLAGPTGTGKTMIANLLASNLDLPSLTLEGSQYNSESQISRLVGSAPDYRGPDEGKLFLHARDNPNALVFIDELEKMHRAFIPYLMNFYDKGTLEAGSGAVVHRPGITILLGTNAGAEQLRRGMSQREIKDILGRALGRGDGVNLDWFVARLQVIPMLAIDQESFKNAVRKNLDEIGSRFGVITANLRLQEVDDAACEILFDAVQEVCRFESESSFGANIGFDTGRAEKSFNSDSTFKDLRYLAQALDRLVGDSLQELVIEQINSGKHNERSKISGFKLIGDRQSGTIKAKRLD